MPYSPPSCSQYWLESLLNEWRLSTQLVLCLGCFSNKWFCCSRYCYFHTNSVITFTQKIVNYVLICIKHFLHEHHWKILQKNTDDMHMGWLWPVLAMGDTSIYISESSLVCIMVCAFNTELLSKLILFYTDFEQKTSEKKDRWFIEIKKGFH